MGLREVMRKAAGLLVELPPETPSESSTELADFAALGENTPSENALEDAAQSTFGAATSQKISGQNASGPVKSVEQIAREQRGPSLEQVQATVTAHPAQAALPLTAQGNVDFTAIYSAAQLPETPFSAEQMLEVLASLPADLPLEVKRQTMKVTIGAMGKTVGATPETIVADASRKLAALAAYEQSFAQRTETTIAAQEKEIATLEERIRARRAEIEEARRDLTRLGQMCDTESSRLDDVLEFFSLDVPPSKYAGQEAGKSTGAGGPQQGRDNRKSP